MSPRTLTPSSLPPLFLSTPSSNLYRHIHPLLLLSTLYLRFTTLVADPIATLTTMAVPLAACQVVYCVVCLPPWVGGGKGSDTATAGGKGDGGGGSGSNNGVGKDSGTTTTTTTKKPKRVQFAKTASPATLSSKITPALLSLLLSLALSVPLTLLLILHGAPLTTHHAGTFLLALHMALLICPPLVYVHGVDRRMWREILTLSLPMDEMWGGVVGCLLGTLLGQVALPLDWDRDWQRWPVPLVVGAYAGWMLGRVVGEWGIKGWRIDFKNGGEEAGKLDGE